MLKLMKYEFRKLRNTLLIMLAVLAGLELGFLAGSALNKNALMYASLALISTLAFAVYGYILVAGIVSYSRELRDRSGYLTFMVPVRPVGIVLSKLVFTALAALAATALFAGMAWLDYQFLFRRLNLDPNLLNQLSLMMRLGLQTNVDLAQLLRLVGWGALTVLLQVMLTMCTAYLAITLSATLLQNKRGFLRGLISFALFAALTWLSGWLSQKLVFDRVSLNTGAAALQALFGWSVLLDLAFCAAFTACAALLLDRKIDL